MGGESLGLWRIIWGRFGFGIGGLDVLKGFVRWSLDFSGGMNGLVGNDGGVWGVRGGGLRSISAWYVNSELFANICSRDFCVSGGFCDVCLTFSELDTWPIVKYILS